MIADFSNGFVMGDMKRGWKTVLEWIVGKTRILRVLTVVVILFGSWFTCYFRLVYFCFVFKTQQFGFVATAHSVKYASFISICSLSSFIRRLTSSMCQIRASVGLYIWTNEPSGRLNWNLIRQRSQLLGTRSNKRYSLVHGFVYQPRHGKKMVVWSMV